jgi:MFS transporter, SP family, inositol transporter
MRYVDRVNQKRLFMVGAVLQIFALLLFAIFPLSVPVALGYVLFLGIGAGFAQQPFFQLWSGEMFPMLMRSTAQGLMFAVVRIGPASGASSSPRSRRRASTRWRGSSPPS